MCGSNPQLPLKKQEPKKLCDPYFSYAFSLETRFFSEKLIFFLKILDLPLIFLLKNTNKIRNKILK